MKPLLNAICLFCAAVLQAEVPALINYQGLLTDINGNVVSGSKTVSISIHDAATDGTQLYTENIGSVTVQNGIYSFQFGSGPTFASTLSTGAQHWLQVTLDGIAQTPRERLVSVPFAMRAAQADTAGLDASAEARLRNLEDNFVLNELDDHAYRNLAKPLIPPNLVWESFPLSNGTNGRVTSASEGSYLDQQFYAMTFSVQDLTQVSVTGVAGLRLFKTLAPNAKLHRAEAEFYQQFSSQPVRFTFRYADSTSADVNLTYPGTYSWEKLSAINPQPSKIVSTLEVYLNFSGNGTQAFVRNAKAATATPASITISLAPQSSNWVSFRVAAHGARESGDDIKFSITNGATTLSNLGLNSVHTWTGSSPPTALTLSVIPKVDGTFKTTSATTLGVFYNQ